MGEIISNKLVGEGTEVEARIRVEEVDKLPGRSLVRGDFWKMPSHGGDYLVPRDIKTGKVKT